MAAGVMTSAASAAMATTDTAPYANDRRKYIGKTAMVARHSATVAAENTTVRPAVRMVRRNASSGWEPSPISSRYLLTNSSE